MQKLAKQTLKNNEKYTKRHKDLTWFGQSTYVHKGDEQFTINMRVKNAEGNNHNKIHSE